MSRRSISIRPGPCRSRSSRKRSFRACSAIPATSRARRSASSTGRGAEVDPKRIDWSTERAANYTLRQDSGAGNSLGSIRIDMPNKHAVYMHDTPSKRLFGADYRFFSHGCVRVQGVYDLAAWLLEGTSGGAGRRLGQGCAARRDQERRARGHQADARDAGDLGLSDRLGERRRRRQFPQRRLWSRRRGGRHRRTPRRLRRSPRRCASRLRRQPRNERCAAAAEPRRSLRRARRRRRARRADGQSRRTLPSPRPDASAAAAGRRGNGSRACARSRAAIAASGATATPSCSFSTNRPRSPPATGRASSAAAPTRRRSAAPSPPAAAERAGDGRRSPPRAARRPSRAPPSNARSPNCPTAR